MGHATEARKVDCGLLTWLFDQSGWMFFLFGLKVWVHGDEKNGSFFFFFFFWVAENLIDQIELRYQS